MRIEKNTFLNILNKTIEWSMYILVLCIPFSKSLIEISITVLFFAWIGKKILLKNFKLKFTSLGVSLLAFFIASFLSMVNAENKMFVSYALITKCLKWIFLFIIVSEELDSDVKLKNLLKISLLSAIIVVIDSFIQYYITHYDLLLGQKSFKYTLQNLKDSVYIGFPTGPFGFPNDLSAWMLVILIPTLLLTIFGLKDKWAKVGLGIFSLGGLYLFYLANTRSAWLGFITSISVILFFKKIRLLVAILLVLLVIFPFLSEEKMKDIFGVNSIFDRMSMWRTGWKIFLQHPIVGNGLNTFYDKFKEFRNDEDKGKLGSYAHNGFLQIAADIGIFGLLCFMAIILQVFYYSLRYIRNCKNMFYQSLGMGLSGGLFAYLIHSFFDTNLHSLPLVALFWVNMAVLMSLQNTYAKNV